MPRCRWILQDFERLITWARMSFKPAKSRSLVLRKGKVTDQFCFSLEDTMIPSLSEKPVKSFLKLFFLAFYHGHIRTSRKFVTWIYQNGILLRLLWPLLVY